MTMFYDRNVLNLQFLNKTANNIVKLVMLSWLCQWDVMTALLVESRKISDSVVTGIFTVECRFLVEQDILLFRSVLTVDMRCPSSSLCHIRNIR